MNKSVSLEWLEKWCEKKLSSHRKERDIDGFPVCPIVEINAIGIAPKGEWLGDEKSRKQAIKDLAERKKYAYCLLCNTLKEQLRAARKEARE